MTYVVSTKPILPSASSNRNKIVINQTTAVHILKANVKMFTAVLLLENPSLKIHLYLYMKPLMVVDTINNNIMVLRYNDKGKFRMQELHQGVVTDPYALAELFLEYARVFKEDLGIHKLDKVTKGQQ